MRVKRPRCSIFATRADPGWCTPTKALVASAKVAYMARRGPEYGVNTGEIEIDYSAVRARMNAVRDNSGMVSWISSAKTVSLFEAWARFEGPRQIRVGDESITADRIYINAGTWPRVPEIAGLDTVPWLDNGVPLGHAALEHSVFRHEFVSCDRRQFGLSEARYNTVRWLPWP